MDDRHQTDTFEKRLRFGCGFVFGGIVLLILGMREITVLTGGFWAFVVGGALIFGFLAMRFGDDFWQNISKWF